MRSWLKPTRMEWITFFALMPVLCILLNSMLFPGRWNQADVWRYSFPVIYIQGLASWYLHIISMHWLRKRFPDIGQTITRLTILAITHISLTSITFITIFYTYDYFHFLHYQLDQGQLLMSLLLSVALTMLATATWEADYTIRKWKESLSEKEMLQQMAIQQEFEALKSQVNPHFLFNCFNTLSSLIAEDTQRADTFLNELSKVYRYLLRNNEDGLSTVQNELQFIESYFRLLKTRHGEAIQYQVEVDPQYQDFLLPSLTLQLLVENVVKHNMLSKNKPLIIDIFTMAGQKLVVNNNLQPRIIKGPSNNVGLENIRTKYALLDQPGFQVFQDDKNFTVVLPLIFCATTEQSTTIISTTQH
ncbi:MAG: histidine kinase [Chitinophagaceae bacterium]